MGDPQQLHSYATCHRIQHSGQGYTGTVASRAFQFRTTILNQDHIQDRILNPSVQCCRDVYGGFGKGSLIIRLHHYRETPGSQIAVRLSAEEILDVGQSEFVIQWEKLSAT